MTYFLHFELLSVQVIKCPMPMLCIEAEFSEAGQMDGHMPAD